MSSVLRFEWARGTRGQGEPARAAPGWNVRACVVANGTRAPALQLVWPAQAPEVGEGERQERCQRRSDRQKLEHRAARFARTNERVGGCVGACWRAWHAACVWPWWPASLGPYALSCSRCFTAASSIPVPSIRIVNSSRGANAPDKLSGSWPSRGTPGVSVALSLSIKTHV